MARHEIGIPDRMRGQELRTVVWDDEAGTVEGDHSRVEWIAAKLAAPKPVTVGDTGRSWELSDPGRDPSEFLALVRLIYWPALEPPLRDTLPPVFDGVEIPRGEPNENPFGLDADTLEPLSP